VTENTDIQESNDSTVSEATAQAASAMPTANWHTWMAAIGAMLAIAAWVALCFNGYTALIVGTGAFVSACLGLHAHTRPWRNLATTALIASAVVLIVIAAFLIVIFWGLNSI